jgi:aldehyde:ferredoxin oxidoreductase
MRDILVDLTRGEISVKQAPSDSLLYGRAFIDWYLTNHGSPSIHPLADQSVIIVSPGLLAGTSAPSSGRTSVGGKSPLTGGIKEANAGGPAGHKLGRLRVRSIVVTGKAAEWQVLKIDAHGVSLEHAGDIVGVGNYEAARKLAEHYGKAASSLIAGPAGEKLYVNSTVAFTDMEGRPARQAARGGLGAVMGSKRLKAVVVDDSGAAGRRMAADPKAFKDAVTTVSSVITEFPLIQLLHAFGTALIVQRDHDNGSLVTRNHSAGAFEAVANINGDALADWTRDHGGALGHRCMPGCIVACSNIVHDRHGDYLTAGLEFETLGLCGSNLGLTRLEDVAKIDRACDDLGLDTIEFGATVGILNEIGLFEFGDFDRVAVLLEEMAQGTPFGRILGSGVDTTARVFGISRVPAVKRQAIPAHAARAAKGWGVTYATSPQGADHTTGPVSVDRLSPDMQVARSRWSQVINAALDATGLCHFTFLYRGQKQLEAVAGLVSSFYGVDFTIDDLVAFGKAMLVQEIDFNRRAGISEAADHLPEWMRTELLPPRQAVFDVSRNEMDRCFDWSEPLESMPL